MYLILIDSLFDSKTREGENLETVKRKRCSGSNAQINQHCQGNLKDLTAYHQGEAQSSDRHQK
jgi:hypothetical protein